MTTGETVVMGALVVGLAITGWLCIYKAEALAERQRKQFEKYGIVRFNPFAAIVTKSWYPTYLRVSGALIWLWDILLVYLIWFRKPPQ